MNYGQVEPGSEIPDLPTQLEELLHIVWLAEAAWRLSDRINLATSFIRHQALDRTRA